MGHLDHLGIKTDAKPGEDAIYNGALDNAAGVATMLEAARLFAANRSGRKRSVMFIANTGEERGLLGADYYRHPSRPSRRQASSALVDLDMPLLLYPFTDVTAFGADHSTIGAERSPRPARRWASPVTPDPMPEESIFTRSDHYRFVRRGVPAVLLMTGHANGGKAHWDALSRQDLSFAAGRPDPEDRLECRRRATRELNYRIARTLADAPQRPLWLSGRLFRRPFRSAGPRPAARRALSLTSAGLHLGERPVFQTFQSTL